MLKNNILLFLKINTELFIRTYALASKTTDVDAVHDMRVSLKRIDTLLRMLNYKKKANYRLRNSFKLLRRLFKLAGPMRDFQVQVTLLEEMKQQMAIDENIIEKFVYKRSVLIDNFKKGSRNFNFIKAKRNLGLVLRYLSKVSEPELLQQIDLFRESRKKLLKDYSNQGFKAFSLHNARKMVKDLTYLMEMSNTEPPVDALLFMNYKQSGHFLGDWHDRDVMINYLGKIIHKKSNIASENSDNLLKMLKEQKNVLIGNYLETYKNREKE